MHWFVKFINSSVGQKYAVGLTGLGLVGFLIAHLSGNLLVFLGPDALNEYALGLRKLGGLLWLLRIGLVALFVLHVVFTIKLARANRSARPVGYQMKKRIDSSFASAYMVQTGLVVFFFVGYHLAHYTFLWVQPSIKEAGQNLDVYSMVIGGFSLPFNVFLYLAGLACLLVHLNHGASSFFQSLGLNHDRYNGLFRKVGPVLSILLFIGYASIPLSVMLGIVK